MKVLFIHPASGQLEIASQKYFKTGALLPPLGLLYLSKMLEKNGYKAEILDGNAEHITRDSLKKAIKSCDIVGITIYSELFEPSQDLNGINNVSMIINALSNAKIWFEKEPFVAEYMNKTNNWVWDESYVKFLEFASEQPISNWAQIAYQENIQLLEAAKQRLIEGKPVTHRRKDYPELIINKSKGLGRRSGKIYQLTWRHYPL